MKNIYKLIGFIAMLAIIGFGFAACDEDSGGGGDGKWLVGTWINDDDPKYFLLIKSSGEFNGKPIYSTLTFEIHEEGFSGWGGTLRQSFWVDVDGNKIEAQGLFSDPPPATITRQSNTKITIAEYSINEFNGIYTKVTD